MKIRPEIILAALFLAPRSAEAAPPREDAASLAAVDEGHSLEEIRDELDELRRQIFRTEERIDDQETSLRRFTEEVDALAAAIQELEERVAPSVHDVVAALLRVKCGADEFRLPLAATDPALAVVNGLPLGSGGPVLPWETELARIMVDTVRPLAARRAACEKLLASLDPGRFERYVARQRQELTRAQERREADRESLATRNRQLAGYKSRQAGLRKELRNLSSPQESIRGDLKLIIALLGLFSLLIMVVVRRFSLEVQKEWVASGQVIQFMTVTVIISAVLALGLSQLLTQEILGTLLGAIGGYVLSQGIGRSASDKVRKVEDRMDELLRGATREGREARMDDFLKKLIAHRLTDEPPPAGPAGPARPPVPPEKDGKP